MSASKWSFVDGLIKNYSPFYISPLPLYSYGDSAGFTPASHFHSDFLSETKYAANVGEEFEVLLRSLKY